MKALPLLIAASGAGALVYLIAKDSEAKNPPPDESGPDIIPSPGLPTAKPSPTAAPLLVPKLADGSCPPGMVPNVNDPNYCQVPSGPFDGLIKVLKNRTAGGACCAACERGEPCEGCE